MFFNLKNFKILEINFNKPWWQLLVQLRYYFFIILLVVTINAIFWTLIPFIAAKLFEIHNYYICIIIFVIWFLFDLLIAIIRAKVNTKFQLQAIHSVYKNSYSYLITVDPKFHVYRSSGTVVAKIERAARGYEDFLDYISFELVPLAVGLSTIIITLSIYSIFTAIIMTGLVIFMMIIGYYIAEFRINKKKIKFIKSDDNFKSHALENLTQIQLIRATFSSNYRNDLLKEYINENMYNEADYWISFAKLFTFLGSLYIISLFILSILLIYQIKTFLITPAVALGLFLAYTQSAKELIRFSRLLRKINSSKISINDLFKFINNFGQQTFPVLGMGQDINKYSDVITVNFVNLNFDYGKAVLFNDHSFNLIVSNNSSPKLYGIIGPSGSGKTTFLSMLGGQLKPNEGNIFLNDINIYQINDATRSYLIALQGQIASNLLGSVKKNLLLGLPENQYNDQDLIQVIENVGLLNVLNQYNGLQTILGEGGLNLSGGQRQRLNFAALYLRAKFYKPLLILIDEPTSSLDEISEITITNMIHELSKQSLTLVIAHRLKTIEKAQGIIDLSLLLNEKIINIYNPADLINKSNYYKELILGKTQLDN